MSNDVSGISLDSFPRLNETEVCFLWHTEWWDGPLAGMAEYSGEKCWFQFHHMDDEGRHYYYLLYRLSREQAEEAETWKRTMGTYLRDEKTNLYGWVGRDELLHKEDWEGPDLAHVSPIGWFMDGKNEDFYGIKVYTEIEEPTNDKK